MGKQPKRAYELVALSTILSHGPMSASQVSAAANAAGLSLSVSNAYRAVGSLEAQSLVQQNGFSQTGSALYAATPEASATLRPFLELLGQKDDNAKTSS